MGNPLFSPGRISANHFDNELAEVQRNRTSTRSRLPFPKQPERSAMPTDQCCGFDNQKSGSPGKEARPENQPKPSPVRKSPFCFAKTPDYRRIRQFKRPFRTTSFDVKMEPCSAH